MGNYNTDTRKLLEVNDILYKINRKNPTTPIKVVVTEVKQFGLGHYIYRYDSGYDSFFNRSIGKTFFKTKEEAEAEIVKIQKINKKKALLKEYEMKLNKRLKLNNHLIIK